MRVDVLLNPLAVPEPASWALLIAGFASVGVTLRRRASSVQTA
nr:PEPxxWA-CTERM sorting domain-containing protein [Sphingomonas sp. ID1715]